MRTCLQSPARLKQTRDRLGLTQEQIAHLVGISFSTYNRWEKRLGSRGMPGHLLIAFSVASRRAGIAADVAAWLFSGPSPFVIYKLLAEVFEPDAEAGQRAILAELLRDRDAS